MKKQKVFISQPMTGFDINEVKKQRQPVIDKLQEQGYEVLDSILEYKTKNNMWLLGKSIQILSKADYIYFMKGFENSRGCRIEYEVSKRYDIPILETEDY